MYWNGQPALLLLNREGHVCWFADPATTQRTVRLQAVAVGVLDTRACAPGSRFDLWYSDYHEPRLGPVLPPGGLFVAPYAVTMGYTPRQPMLTRWWFSYCDLLQCFTPCGQGVREPEWNAVLCLVQ